MVHRFTLLCLLLSCLSWGDTLKLSVGGPDWNAFHFLGFNASQIAVRELRILDDKSEGEPKICQYGSENDSAAVTLHTWPLPKIGETIEVKPVNSFVIYKASLKDLGCTSEKDAQEKLLEAKATWKKQGLSWEQKVSHQQLFKGKGGYSQFKGPCFQTNKNKKGCKFQSNVKLLKKKFKLELNLLAKSECVTTDDSEFEHGCKAENHYTGSIAVNGSKRFFDILAPDSGKGSPLYTLESIEIYSIGKTTIAVLYFSWTFVTSREKIPVILRLE